MTGEASRPLSEAPLTFEVARALSTINWPQADTADLFLFATAKAFEVTLGTADRNFVQAPGISVMAH
jgi:hypothetical protein